MVHFYKMGLDTRYSGGFKNKKREDNLPDSTIGILMENLWNVNDSLEYSTLFETED